jgi:hypothetical protein
MSGLFGWNTYYDASIMRSPNNPNVETSDQKIAFDPGATPREKSRNRMVQKPEKIL